MRALRKHGIAAALAFTCVLLACSSQKSAPPATAPDPCVRTDHDTLVQARRHTPRWAFEPWISKDISDHDDSIAFVGGFLSRDIPVGVEVLDSPWETNYNTFTPNPSRYGDFGPFVDGMHQNGVRIVVWITQMVNNLSFDLEPGGDAYPEAAPNYQIGADCNYFVNGADNYDWWKGRGSAIDFFNADATAWWHRQQDALFAYGVDGFKLDFGEDYITDDPILTAQGPTPLQQYSEAYYHDYTSYAVAARGDDFVSMTRAWDASYGFAGRFYAKKEDSRVAWMGDNRRDFYGLGDALDEMMISADAGYVVLGSDVGGYLDHDDKNLLGPEIPFDPLVFERWIAIGGLSPFMQLHGEANFAPWTVPTDADVVTTVYRFWAKMHHALVPFFYSVAEEAYAGNGAMMIPVSVPSQTATDLSGDDRFSLANAMFVAPLLDATGMRTVVFPGPATADFYDAWNPGAVPIAGGSSLVANFASDPIHLPLYFQAGAIVPMNIEDDVTGFGNAAQKGALTLLLYPSLTASSFTLHEIDDTTTVITSQKTASGSGAGFHVTLARAANPVFFRVRMESAPNAVTQDGAPLANAFTRDLFDVAGDSYFYDEANALLWARISAGGATSLDAN